MIDDADIAGKLLHLKHIDFCGIGENMECRLREARIETVTRLHATSAAQLRAIGGAVKARVFILR